mmetsp:Transcript_5999/g.16828  ORF Transcript_5999/g.16828 Transcript_5999/m.16828 type:complete len:206 (+) Transcript_5999:978-1595(+)
MWLEAVIRPRFDGNTDAFGCGLFAVLDGLLDRAGMMTRQRIVQIADEIILVFAIQAHERSAHDDVFDLVHSMAQRLELGDASSGLTERVVARSDGPHRRRFVSSVRLRRVFKVRIRSTGTVHADVARHGNVRTPMRLGHDGHHGHSTGRADRLLSQIWHQLISVAVREGCDDVGHLRDALQLILARRLRFQLGKVERRAAVIRLH